MDLDSLLDLIDYSSVGETKDKEIDRIAYHSDEAGYGSVFFALPGRDTDGSLYIREALAGGCRAIVIGENSSLAEAAAQAETFTSLTAPAGSRVIAGDTAPAGVGHACGDKEPSKASESPVLIKVKDIRRTMALAASRLYGEPSKELIVIGVTGTKGKTSVAYMVWKILEDAGMKCGIIGTIFNGFKGHMAQAERTTPESAELQRSLREMKDAGCKAAVIEVSSQGMMMSRTDFVDFDIGIFTNLSPDHIGRGEHKNYEEYRYWKSRFFGQCRTAVMNTDDKEYLFMTQAFMKSRAEYERAPHGAVPAGAEAGAKLRPGAVPLLYGRAEKADFRIEDIELRSESGILGIKYMLREKCLLKDKPTAKEKGLPNDNAPAKGKSLRAERADGLAGRETGGDGQSYKVEAALPGDFNAYNSAAAIAAARALGVPAGTALKTIKSVRIPGRAEIVGDFGDFTVMVDYAHNGTALASLLKNLRGYRPGRLVAVFGCGGDRDKSRRREMGEAASRLADIIIVTSDNPRTEAPMTIIDDILRSISEDKEVLAIPDRREAIKKAVEIGEKGDIIVVAGKGHETYQIVGGEKRHFDDREEILSFGKEIL